MINTDFLKKAVELNPALKLHVEFWEKFNDYQNQSVKDLLERQNKFFEESESLKNIRDKQKSILNEYKGLSFVDQFKYFTFADQYQELFRKIYSPFVEVQLPKAKAGK